MVIFKFEFQDQLINISRKDVLDMEMCKRLHAHRIVGNDGFPVIYNMACHCHIDRRGGWRVNISLLHYTHVFIVPSGQSQAACSMP